MIKTKKYNGSKIAVISHGNSARAEIRDLAFRNHKDYCLKHGYTYICDTGEISETTGKKDARWRKVELILNHLPNFEWVVWIDCDAFFVDLEKKLEEFTEETQAEIIFSKSPPVHNAPFINSGVFFCKNTDWTNSFLKTLWKAGPVNFNDYDSSDWGFSCPGGDQDAMIMHLKKTFKKDIKSKVQFYDYKFFNAREGSFNNISEYFVVHFPGNGKREKVLNFFGNKNKIMD